MSARRSDFSSHNQQASQLRDQLKGLLPESLQPAAASAAASVANEAGDGMQKLLSYARLAAEYQEPIVALLQRLLRRAPAEAAAIPAARAVASKRRFGVHPLVAVGIAVGLGLASYGVIRVVQDVNRNA